MSKDDIESKIIELAKQIRSHVQRAEIDPDHDAAAEHAIYEMIDLVGELEEANEKIPKYLN